MIVKHPAKFSDPILREMERFLRRQDPGIVLDPMAGSNKLKALDLPGFTLLCSELEWPWCRYAGKYRSDLQADATRLPLRSSSVDYIVTSQTYGNRMADHHTVRSGHTYRTYTHAIRESTGEADYKLHDTNTGQMQWGREYRVTHIKIWREVVRVLRPGGLLLMNISDHVRKGEIIPVSDWHCEILEGLDLQPLETLRVKTPRSKGLANDKLRVSHELIFIMEKR